MDGNIIIQVQLGGISSISYDNISVQATEGIHTILVLAKDSNQNEITIGTQIELAPFIDPGDPPVIIIG